jgi:hypothetical protein
MPDTDTAGIAAFHHETPRFVGPSFAASNLVAAGTIKDCATLHHNYWSTRSARGRPGPDLANLPLARMPLFDSGHSRRLRPALARRAVSQREANGVAFDGAGRSTTRAASTQLRVCFSGGAELWANS